jgi:hypothetical protein
MHEVKSLAGSCKCEMRWHTGHLHVPKKPSGLRASSYEYFCVLAANNEQSNTSIDFYSFILLNLKEVPVFSLFQPRLHLN